MEWGIRDLLAILPLSWEDGMRWAWYHPVTMFCALFAILHLAHTLTFCARLCRVTCLYTPFYILPFLFLVLHSYVPCLFPLRTSFSHIFTPSSTLLPAHTLHTFFLLLCTPFYPAACLTHTHFYLLYLCLPAPLPSCHPHYVCIYQCRVSGGRQNNNVSLGGDIMCGSSDLI